MYSVFIVDDEIIVREGLRSKIDWEHSPFSFAGEAGDGEIALSMIQDIKPDILITDIRMPFMDGLELARTVKKIQPWIRIIILSGHDEFDYAKKAISIGVEDYILKPFTLEELVASLNKVAAMLDRQKQQFTDISRLKSELESTFVLAREKLLTDLVFGALDSGTVIQRAADFDINLISHYYTVSVGEIHSREDAIDALVAAKSRIMAFIKDEDDVIGFFVSPNTFVAIIKAQAEEACEDRAFSVAESVKHEVSQIEGVTIVSAIGPVIEHTANIPKSFQDAFAILKKSRFQGMNKIISSNDVDRDLDGSIVLQENDPLVDRLNYADESEIDQIIKEYIALLGENTGHFSIIASYLLVDVIMAVSKVIEGLGGDVKQVMPEILTHSFVESAVQSEEVFISEIKRVLSSLLAYRNEHVQGRYADVILHAKKYIDKNFANPDICLRSAAEEVNFSPNHFSTIFSQDCGMTFIEYLTSVRVEQAKKLLKSTDMKSADVAYEVGFNDPHYFSFLFKKVTGLSPREWRNSNTESLVQK